MRFPNSNPISRKRETAWLRFGKPIKKQLTAVLNAGI